MGKKSKKSKNRKVPPVLLVGAQAAERRKSLRQKAGIKPKKKRRSSAKITKPHKDRVFVADYQEYLRSDWWKACRYRKLRSAGFRCNRCRATSDLAVHHLHYRTLCREKDGDLEVLCKSCHDVEHTAIVEGDAHLRSINRCQ